MAILRSIAQRAVQVVLSMMLIFADQCRTARCHALGRSDGRDVIFIQQPTQKEFTSNAESKLQEILNKLENNWYRNQQEILQMVKEVINN